MSYNIIKNIRKTNEGVYLTYADSSLTDDEGNYVIYPESKNEYFSEIYLNEGNDEYLKKQFEKLEQTNYPTIIKTDKKYHFGKLYKEFYEIHNELLKQTNIEFDLLYDSLGWICFEKYVNSLNNKDYSFLYIHQGGLLGNISMLERYKYKLKE